MMIFIGRYDKEIWKEYEKNQRHNIHFYYSFRDELRK